ncbi:MAG: hypothetical protein ACLP1D_16485 [Xanthobacteraceae bacterium]
MSRMLRLLAAGTAAWVLATTSAPAQGYDPKRCGNRVVVEPEAPLRPGCQRWDCQLSFRPAQDEKGVYCIRVFTCAVYCPKPKTPAANEPQIFNNWNSGACGVTDVATLTIDRPVRLQRIEIWYNWRPDETTAHYTASRGDKIVAEGELARAECAPNQGAWCVARAESGTDMEPGTYAYRTERPAICQNSGSAGKGFIRAYSASPSQ